MAKFRPISILPSAITLASGVCGFGAILVAAQIRGDLADQDAQRYLQIAGWLIFLGYILDGIDGRIARMTNSVSKFGGELDSLSDMVTFGVAPAFILLKLGPSIDRPIICGAFFAAAVIYLMCTMIRLARFNVQANESDEKPRFFRGLPCPAAAGCIAALAISSFDIQALIDTDDTAIAQSIRLLLPLATLGIALLMVSTIRYSKFPNRSLRESHWLGHVVLLLFLVLAVFVLRERTFAIVFWGFALLEPLYRVARQRFQLHELPSIDDEEEEPESVPVEL